MPNESNRRTRRTNDRNPYSRRNERQAPDRNDADAQDANNLFMSPGFSIATRIRDHIRSGLQEHMRGLRNNDNNQPFRITVDLSSPDIDLSSNREQQQRTRSTDTPDTDTPAHRTRQRSQQSPHRGIPYRGPRFLRRPSNDANLIDSLNQISQLFRNPPPDFHRRLRDVSNHPSPVHFMTLNLVSEDEAQQRSRQPQPSPLRRSRRLNNLPPEESEREPQQHHSSEEDESLDEPQLIAHRFHDFSRDQQPNNPIQQHFRRLVRENRDGSRDVGAYVVTRTYHPNLNEMDRIPDEEGTRNIFPGFDAFFDPFESFTYDDWLNFQEALGNARPRDTGVDKEIIKKLKKVLVGKMTASIPTNKCACVICMTDYENGENAILLNCKHHYHDNCITKWFEAHSTCPVCRDPVKK